MNPFESKSDTIRPIKGGVRSTNPFEQQKANDTKTPEGLYNLAVSAGLKDQADKMVQRSGGESQKYMSGGFIMDVMDVLNTSSYGMVGLVKGKGFLEGVKNRETLSDDDALGKYGWQGKVAGFLGDILLDPLTYIAPIKLVTKIPGVAKGLQKGSQKLLGELETIEVMGQKTFKREGGWTPLTFLADKFVYGFAADRTFLDGVQKIAGRNEAIMSRAEVLLKNLNKLTPGAFGSTIQRGADGRMISVPLNELEISMKRNGMDKDFESVSEIYKLRDDLMDSLVDANVISKETKDQHWGTYLKQSYDEYLEAKSITGTKSGIGMAPKKRKEDLTPEMMQELGQVTDPHVLWATTLLKQIDLLKKAQLQQYTAKGFAMTDELLGEFKSKGGSMDDLFKVPDSSSYKLNGKRVSLANQLSGLRNTIKNIKKERRAAGADLNELESTIGKLSKELDRMKGMTEEQLGEAWSGVKQLIKESGIYDGPIKKAPTSVGQRALADQVSTWLNRGTKTDRLAREAITSKDLWKEMRGTKEGFAVERAFQDPRLMYQWKSPEEFLDSIRYPDKSKIFQENVDRTVELTDAQALARIKKAEEAVRKVGQMEQEKLVLSETNLKLVQDAVERIEDEYADALWQKSNILKELDTMKYGDLAGKYVSKEVWNALKGSFEPSREVGENWILKFKHVKVVWNPASHVRNAFSATIQNWWKLGIGPWRLDTYWDARKELKNGGKYLKEMQDMGFNERSGYMAELLNNYLTNKELMKKSLAHQVGEGIKITKTLKSIDRMLMNSYGHTDNIAKVAAYKYGISKGLKKEDAYAQAMAATFNYSEITPFVHQMRRAIWGVPFITFALKATPLVASTIVNNPGRISVFGKIRNDLFKAAGVEGEQEAEALPDYMRDDQFVMRLPWKDELGRSMYFDMSYIIPVGALADGTFFKDPLSMNPITQLIRELSTNETFGGKQIFKESDDRDKIIMDVAMHIGKLYLPPPITDGMPEGYNSDGERARPKLGWRDLAGINTQDLGTGERTYYQRMARLVGVGAIPYELNSKESALAYKQKENLTQLLQENGIVKTFNVPYLPKDSELRPENQGMVAPPIYDRDVRPIGR